jgi:hypothetical protein
VRFEFEFETFQLFYLYYLFYCRIVFACDRCDMACSVVDHDKSRRPRAEDQGWLHRLGTRWSGDREVEWRVSGMHRASGDKERGFLG